MRAGGPLWRRVLPATTVTAWPRAWASVPTVVTFATVFGPDARETGGNWRRSGPAMDKCRDSRTAGAARVYSAAPRRGLAISLLIYSEIGPQQMRKWRNW